MIRAACIAFALWAGGADAACRQALALGLDVSGSVDAQEYRLQLDGLATALLRPAVQEVLLLDGAAPVRIAVYEWSGPKHQRLILPWTEISDASALLEAAARLRNHQRGITPPTTAIGSAILSGFRLLEEQPECWQRTLDISGDGPVNTGPRPQDIPAEAMPAGAVVNALVIGLGDQRGNDHRYDDIKELSAYFAANVIRGAGAFVETALGFDDYADAMERKLLRELQSLALGKR